MDNKRQEQKSSPYGYKKSIFFIAAILVVGVILQIIFGKFDIRFLHAPLNIILGAITILSLIAFSLFRKSRFYRWFSGITFSVSLIVTMAVLGIFMGLIPQQQTVDIYQHDIYSLLGLRNITSSWYFVLIYFLLLLSLGALIIRRLYDFNIKDYAFYFNHIGLWMLLFAAGLGAADKEKYTMYAYEGKEESYAQNEQGEMKKLPMIITLNDFDMEEYPPKLVIIDDQTLTIQHGKKPSFFQIDPGNNSGVIMGWNIKVLEYIPQAINIDADNYKEVDMPGASPAVKLIAKNKETGDTREGWIYLGNEMQTYAALKLTDDYSMVMIRPEAKRYVSDLNVYPYGKEEQHVLLEVNKPFRTNSWMIYQYGYDTKAGRLSTYSILEIVYDPWLYGAYLGMLLLGIGSICLLWSGNKRKTKEEKDDME